MPGATESAQLGSAAEKVARSAALIRSYGRARPVSSVSVTSLSLARLSLVAVSYSIVNCFGTASSFGLVLGRGRGYLVSQNFC